MFKFSRMLCVMVVCAVAGAALGAVIKIKDLTAVGPGLSENPACDGMSILHWKPQQGENGETQVNVVINNFQPNTVYGVRYEDQFGTGGEFSQAITTNPAGNGHWHDSNMFDVTSSPRVIIFIDDDNDFAYTPGEERACGGFNCNF
jgi:hypothetical protein